MSNRPDPRQPTTLVTTLLAMAPVVAVLSARAVMSPDRFDALVMGERGWIELTTVILLVPALGLGIAAARRHHGLARAWLLALSLTCLYFGGEEISWGQHLFGWDTPAALREINDQQETNLHNMSSWLDQKPRLLFELWVLGLALAAASRRFRHAWGRLAILWSDRRLLAAATLAILVRLPERLVGDDPLPPLLNFRLAEFQELMFAVVLLLYLWVAARPPGLPIPARPAPGARRSDPPSSAH